MGAASSVTYDTSSGMNMNQKRASMMLKASIVSDAASMPLHWIYDQSVIAAKLSESGDATNAAFFPTPSCPFYSYPAGVLSPYGDESLPLIHSIASKGEFVQDHAAETMADFFSTYPNVEGQSKGYAGRLNHAPKSFLTARQEGKEWSECSQDDNQANGLAKVPVIVARYVGSAREVIDEKVVGMVSIMQTPEVCKQSSLLLTRLLELLIVPAAATPTFASPKEAIVYLKEHAEECGLATYQQNILNFLLDDEKSKLWTSFSATLQAVPADPNDGHRLMRVRNPIFAKFIEHSMDLDEAIRNAGLNEADAAFVQEHRTAESQAEAPVNDVLKMAQLVGLSCHLPCALVVALHIVLHSANLSDAMEANIKAGGDSCSRALVIGAVYGALPDAEIPESWMKSINGDIWRAVSSAADKIAADNTYLA
eukprot:gene27511-33230_t